MEILRYFTKEELKLLMQINIIIEDKEYDETKLKELYKKIYKKGYIDTNVTYAEAEKYKSILEKIKVFSKIDIEKLKKYSPEEFEDDYYIATVLMHETIRSNPKRINQHRKGSGKDSLAKEEYEKLEEKNKINTDKFEKHMKYLEEKYGKDLNEVSKYYELMKSNNNSKIGESKMSNVIINPEYLKLIEKIKQLKEDIASLYEEKDELVYQTCKNIETEYMSKVGVLEYKLYEFQCKILRLKRKIELYQINIYRQEIPNEKEIEEKLDIEYKEYEKKLNKMSNDIQEALNRKNYSVLSEEDGKELKNIYRK